MNSGGYTYARLVEQGVESWIAASEFPVAVGDTVTATVSLPMKQFHSRTLDRDFALIHFVGQVSKNGEIVVPGQAGINDAPAATGRQPAESASPGGSPAPLVEKVSTPPGGMSIADVWAKRATASGQTVVVRGRVVKANYDILGANWYHLQDGSGVVAAGTHDLTVTSPARAAIGDIVIATGVLATSKDFGGGYTYDVVVEDARLTK